DEALGRKRLLDVTRGDGAEELVVVANGATDRQLEVLELAGELRRLLLGLLGLDLGDALLVLDARDVALGRRDGQAARDEVVACEAGPHLDELAALAERRKLVGEDDMDVTGHDGLLGPRLRPSG